MSNQAPILFLLCAGASLWAQTPSVDQSISQAVDSLRNGKAAEAEQFLQPLTKIKPNNAAIWNLLGAALDEQKKFAAAEDAFLRATRLAPRAAQVWNNLGNHYIARGDSVKASSAFRTVLTLDPGHPNANLQLARLAVDRKNGADALPLLDALKGAGEGEPAVQLLRARALALAGRKTDALAVLEPAEKKADSAAAWYSIGLAYADFGDYPHAEQSFSRALEAEPANVDVLYNLGLASLRAGHPQRSQQVIEAALAIRPNEPEFLFQLGRALAAQKRFDDAIPVLVRARKLAPDKPAILRFLAETSAQAGFFGDAAGLFTEYLKTTPKDDVARRQRGTAYASAGNRPDAVKDLEWYLNRHPDDPEAYFALGFALTSSDTQRALANLDKGISMRPDYLEARIVRGALYLRLGRTKEAAADLEMVVRARPGDPEPSDLLGQAYLALERPQDAVAVLRPANENAPENTKILMHLGRALRDSGNEDEGNAVLEKLAKIGPNRSLDRSMPGILNYFTLTPDEQRKRTEINLRSVLKSRGSDFDIQSKLASVLLDEGKTDEAMSMYRSILAGDASAEALLLSGRDLMQVGRYDLAVEFLRKSIELDAAPSARLDLAISTAATSGPEAALRELRKTAPTDRKGDYYLLEAQFYDGLGKLPEAIRSLNACLALAPKRPDLYRDATMFLFKNRMDAEALNLLDVATRNVPDDQELLLLKAVALGLSRRFDEAAQVLGTVIKRWPEWGRPYLVRGIFEENHSRSAEALKDIQTAMSLGDRSPEAYLYLAMALNHAKPEEGKRALDAARKAIELSPADPWAKIMAGRLCITNNDPAAAVGYLKDALKAHPELAQAHFWMGSAWRAMGKMDEAEAEMAEVARIRDNNPREEENEGGGVRDKLFALPAERR
ncbi:MAG: tetratricopeptide repeat protein [Bryobacteraceae bacterium]